MARKRGDCGHKLEGAQADVKAEESKRGPELKKDDVVVKVEESEIGTKLTMNGDRHDIDDILDYVEVKLEDLELEGDEMDELTTPKTEKNEGGAPLKPKKKKKKNKNKNKKKRSQEAKSESEAAVQVKSESTALPNPEMNIAPKATDGGCGAYPKPKEEKPAKIEADFFAKWDEYFGKRELADWQRLCRDLGLPGDLPSKTQCRKALEKVHVNIDQFLEAMAKGEGVLFFKNVRKLALYTRKTGLWLPRSDLPKGDPLRTLLREISRYL